MTTEHQFFLDDGDVFGTLYLPAMPVARALVCHPLFEERKSSHRILVETARALCREGIAVLRFDYRGCGDSHGAFRDFGVEDWCGDVRLAASCLSRRVPGVPFGIVGLRLGCPLALAASDPMPRFAVLWEPVTDGRIYIEQELRRKLVREMVTFGKGRASREALRRTLAEGGEVDLDGYALSGRLHDDLCALDLAERVRDFPGTCCVFHVTHRERMSPEMARFRELVGGNSAGPEFRIVREQPFWNLIGLVDCGELMAATVDWVRRQVDA